MNIPFEHLLCLAPPFLPVTVAEFVRRSYLYRSVWSIEQEALFHAVPIALWDQLDVYVQAKTHDLAIKARQLEEDWSWNFFLPAVRQNWNVGDRLKLERLKLDEVMNSSGWYLTQHRQSIIQSYNLSHPDLVPLMRTDNLVLRLPLTTWKRTEIHVPSSPYALDNALTQG